MLQDTCSEYCFTNINMAYFVIIATDITIIFDCSFILDISVIN